MLVGEHANVIARFGLILDEPTFCTLGSSEKLEMLSTVLATDLWCRNDSEALHVFFGDNDGVRFSLIRASSGGDVALKLIQLQLSLEAEGGLRSWYARVP